MEELGALRGDNTADNTGQTEHGDTGHQRLDLMEGFSLSVHIIQQEAKADRKDNGLNDGYEHRERLNRDLRTAGKERYQQGRHKRGKQGGYRRHADREGNIAAAEVGHDVGGYAAGAAADQDQTERDAVR